MLNLELPYWQDYLELLMQLGVDPFGNAQVPGPDQLNTALAPESVFRSPHAGFRPTTILPIF